MPLSAEVTVQVSYVVCLVCLHVGADGLCDVTFTSMPGCRVSHCNTALQQDVQLSTSTLSGSNVVAAGSQLLHPPLGTGQKRDITNNNHF